MKIRREVRGVKGDAAFDCALFTKGKLWIVNFDNKLYISALSNFTANRYCNVITPTRQYKANNKSGEKAIRSKVAVSLRSGDTQMSRDPDIVLASFKANDFVGYAFADRLSRERADKCPRNARFDRFSRGDFSGFFPIAIRARFETKLDESRLIYFRSSIVPSC